MGSHARSKNLAICSNAAPLAWLPPPVAAHRRYICETSRVEVFRRWQSIRERSEALALSEEVAAEFAAG